MLILPKAAKTQWAKVTHRSVKGSDCVLVSLAQRPWYPGYGINLLVNSVSQTWADFFFPPLLGEGWKTVNSTSTP